MREQWKQVGGVEAHLGIVPEIAPPELIAAVDDQLAKRSRHRAERVKIDQPSRVGATGESPCRYVREMIDGWTTDIPPKRHNWYVSQRVRLDCARELGCIAEADHTAALAVLDARLDELCAGDRIADAGEIRRAGVFAAQKAASKSEYGLWDELGHHDHATPTEVQPPRGGDHDGQPVQSAEAGFWESRESLSRIRDYALSCMVSPWGLLGAAIVYVLDTVPFSTALPGIADDDSPGSLNVFVNLVGQSGGNKGRTCKMARRYLGRTEVDIPPGSGEGLVKIFVRRVVPDDVDKDGRPKVEIHEIGGDSFVFKRHAAVLDCAEVDSLLALGSRNGSTLFSILRQGFSGETLGFGYSDESKRLLVPGDQYRLGLIVGVQPERAGVLLDDAAGGTPQRFLWLPVTDPRISRANRPTKPAPLRLAHTRAWPQTFGMCEAAREQIELAAEQRAQGVGDPLDGHALFVRAKVAAALSVLDGERHAISDEDWHLAGTVMAISDLTRARCASALARAAERANEARGRGEGIRTAVAGEIVHERAIERAAGVLVRAAQAHGPMTAAGLRKRLAARDRGLFDDAYAVAVQAGRLVEHEGEVKVP